jgi:hypothetical protein
LHLPQEPPNSVLEQSFWSGALGTRRTGCYAYYLAGIVQLAAGAGQDASPSDKAVAPPFPACPACRARLPGLAHLTRTCTLLRRRLPQVSRKHAIVMAGPDMPGSAAR